MIGVVTKNIFRLIFLILAVVFVCLSIFSVALTASIKCPLKTGFAYKTPSDKNVYYITDKCTKQLFTSPSVFFQYFKAWKDVRQANKIYLNRITKDKNYLVTVKNVAPSPPKNLSVTPPQLPVPSSQSTLPSLPILPISEQNSNNRNEPEAITISTADSLLKLFNISLTTPLPLEKNCLTNQYQLPTASVTKTVSSVEGTRKFSIGVTDTSSERLNKAQYGLTLLEQALPRLESYFGSYPCPELAVHANVNHAGGSPGIIFIGEEGLKQRWLLYHEFTHSYFSSNFFNSWSAEGAADFIPFIIIFEQMDARQAGWIDVGHIYEPGQEPKGGLRRYIEIRANDESSPVLLELKRLNIPLTARLCDVETDYLAGSYLGQNLFEQVYLKIGKTNFLNAMRTLYFKYRLSQTKITYNDMYRTFLFFTPTQAQSDMQQYLSQKLCQ